MSPLTCAATRRRLDAYCDHELSLDEEVAVAAHLDWCDACAVALDDMRRIGAALRTFRSQEPLGAEEAAGFFHAVVNRARAERDASTVVRVRAMFDDWHLVYAGLGAAAATLACVLVMLGMMRFATIERPDSLAAIVNFLATPGSNENPVAIDNRVLMPRVLDAAFSSAADGTEQDVVFTLAAVVTREGRIANLELLRANDHTGDGTFVEGLLDAVSRARFEPARVAGLPVAVNMVWMVARTTVRATAAAKRPPIEIVAPGKKRIAALDARPDREAI